MFQSKKKKKVNFFYDPRRNLFVSPAQLTLSGLPLYYHVPYCIWLSDVHNPYLNVFIHLLKPRDSSS